MISASIDSLFSGLIGHLLVPAFRSLGLACIVALALIPFRKKSAALRLSVWTCVLYAALAMPLLSQLLPAIPLGILSACNFAPAALNSGLSLFAESLSARPVDNNAGQAVPMTQIQAPEGVPVSWPMLVIAIYLSITALLLARLGLGWLMSRKLRRASRAITDPHVLDEFTIRAKAAKVARLPALSESEAVTVPLTLGIIRPLILLPCDWRGWDEPKLSAVLVHELSHVSGRDYLRQMLAAVHHSIFWFSPLSWWLKNYLAELAEQVGDDSALLVVSDRVYYAEVLLGFFKSVESARRRICLQGISMARCGRATRRLDRILEARNVLSPHLKKWAIAGLILFVTPLVYLMAAVRPSITQEPISLSAAAAQAVSSSTLPGLEGRDMAELSKPVQSARTLPVAPETPSRLPTANSAEQSGIGNHGNRMLRTIKIIGSTYFSPVVLESKLKIVRLNSWVGSDMVSADVELNLKSFLKEHGFLQSEVQWSFVPPEGRDVALQLRITEGPQFRLAKLVIKGVTAFTPEEISSQFKLYVGDVLNLIEVKSSLERIKSMYAEKGFINSAYLPEMNYDLTKRAVSLTFTFEEGIQFRVAYVGFVGCSDQTQEDRLRAQVSIHPGEIYSAGKEKAAFAELKKFGVIKDTVEIIDEERGLIGIAFWLQESSVKFP